eukprot:TRINITY_DN860_c0_g1_i1.p1 TRINITY_DN860_c0_g1~~TRINITY_DN860_c0_g1_i1.p1  ORF type:complete len:566 (+),score=114.99 TRINITY_DN860_c0_g1_i1:88-1785(+)
MSDANFDQIFKEYQTKTEQPLKIWKKLNSLLHDVDNIEWENKNGSVSLGQFLGDLMTTTFSVDEMLNEEQTLEIICVLLDIPNINRFLSSFDDHGDPWFFKVFERPIERSVISLLDKLKSIGVDILLRNINDVTLYDKINSKAAQNYLFKESLSRNATPHLNHLSQQFDKMSKFFAEMVEHVKIEYLEKYQKEKESLQTQIYEIKRYNQILKEENSELKKTLENQSHKQQTDDTNVQNELNVNGLGAQQFSSIMISEKERLLESQNASLLLALRENDKKIQQLEMSADLFKEKVKGATIAAIEQHRKLTDERDLLLKRNTDLEEKLQLSAKESDEIKQRLKDVKHNLSQLKRFEEDEKSSTRQKSHVYYIKLIQDTINVNIHQCAMRMGWNGKDKATISIDIDKDVVICSNSTAQPALQTGKDFPPGTTIVVINKGHIIGKGGPGGVKGPGGDGGDAIHISYPITLINKGTIAAGGGGGAGYIQYGSFCGGGGASFGDAAEEDAKGLFLKGGRGASGQSIGGDWAQCGTPWGGSTGGNPGKAILKNGYKIEFKSECNIHGEIIDL